jgi:hypothetical protein
MCDPCQCDPCTCAVHVERQRGSAKLPLASCSSATVPCVQKTQSTTLTLAGHHGSQFREHGGVMTAQSA